MHRKTSEELLKDSEHRYRSLVELSPEAIAVQSEGYIVYINEAGIELLGADSSRRIVGEPVLDFVHPDCHEVVEERMRRILRNEGVGFVEQKWVRVDGEVVDVEVASAPITYSGRPASQIVFRNITGRKRDELILKESERRFRQFFDQSVDILIVHDEKGRILDCNVEACRAHGYEREEMLSFSVGDLTDDLLSEEERERQERAGGTLWQRIVKNEESNSGAVHFGEHQRKDGARFPVEVRLGGVEYGGRRMILASIRDITEQRQAEKEVREAEAKYRMLVEQVPAIVYTEDAENGDTLYDSPQIETILGYSRDICREDPQYWWKIVHPEDLEHVRAAEAAAVVEGKFSLEYRCIARDKQVAWVKDDAKAIYDEKGKPRFWQGVIFDITSRKQMEEALRRSEAHFRTVVENLGEGLLITDINDVVLDMNSRLTQLTGYTEDEMLGHPAYERLLPPERWTSVLEGNRKRFEGEYAVYEMELLRKDGSSFWAEIHGSPYKDASGEIVGTLGAIVDITERKRAEESLRESEERFRTIFEQSAIGISIADPDRRFLETNVAYQRLTGYSGEELYGKEIAELSHPEDVPTDETRNQEVHAGDRDRYQREKRYIRKDGEQIWVRPTISVARDADGEPEFLIGMVEDITERKRAEQALEQSEERYRSVVERTADGLFLADLESNHVLETNAALQRMLGYTAEELLEMTLYDFIVDSKENIDRNSRRVLEEKQAFIGERRYRREDGGIIDVEVSASVIPYGNKEVCCSIVRDVTERKAMERELAYRAFRDPLTGLPNRTLLEDRLRQATARAGRLGERISVLFLDLDNFKVINDSLGHETGDELLVTVSRRLQGCLRPSDTAARLGGDEFVVLLDVDSGVSEASRVAERILGALRIPLVLQGKELVVDASIGIAVGGAGESPGDLLRDADLAMYRAKARGKAYYEVFLPTMHEEALERLNLEDELRRSIEREELKVCYQPKISLATGRINGTEALVRWEHPERGLIMPEGFIPLAEETGLINEIGRWTLEEACRRARVYSKYGSDAPPLEMSVNLSAIQLQQPGFVHEVAGLLQKTGVDPRNLILEITESVIMGEPASNVATLESLKKLGVQLAIDDFGTGYSSLSYLSRFPVDGLKVDRSFVNELGENSGEEIIVSSVIALAHSLNIGVVAEGVETAYQLSRLRELGCDEAQGNYFSVPVPHEEILVLLESEPRW